MQEDNSLDDLFKDHFDNFTPPASKQVWNKIDEDLTQNNVDKVFKDKLGDLQRDPSPQVWTNVKKELPLSLYLRNTLNFLSKIAAVLLIAILSVLVTTHITDQNKAIVETPAIEKEIESKPSEVITPKEETSFVFDLKDKKTKNTKAKTKDVEEDITALLADVLEDDEDLMNEINEERMEALLQPLEQLPIEGIVDDLGDVAISNAIAEEDFPEDYSEDLQIWVPIKFAEDHEIEEMISAYNDRLY